MSGVFISYRRDDSQGWAARLADDLGQALGPDRVFSDIEIPIGADFAAILHRAIAASHVLLVVIGPRWAAPTASGRSRLFDPGDWVRTEIEAALSLAKPVVPVLVGGAALPPADQLPESLRPMLRLQAAPLSTRHWRADVGALADRLRQGLPVGDAEGTGRRDRAEGSGAPPPAGDTLAEVLREIAERVHREWRIPPGATPTPASRRGGQRLLRGLSRRLSRLVGMALVLVAAYAGLRLFGDASVQSGMDAAEQWLQSAPAQAWRRLTAD